MTNDPAIDSDGDGLTDAVEQTGVTIETGERYLTDPTVADSDHDGLADGEEVGAVIKVRDTSSVYVGISNPVVGDTDEDGVADGDEYFVGTNPRSGDTDGDGMPDADELDFGADPLVDNPDGDVYSDREERKLGYSPMSYDNSGWNARISTAISALKVGLSVADKLSGGGKFKAVATAVTLARAANVATPIIWDSLKDWDWSEFSNGRLFDVVFADDEDTLAVTLEGGQRNYVAYVSRDARGALIYAGITDGFDQLTADYGGSSDFSVVSGSEELPLNQARAVAEAVIRGMYDRMDGTDLANTRHVIDPANRLYTPATKWGSDQLERAGFEW